MRALSDLFVIALSFSLGIISGCFSGPDQLPDMSVQTVDAASIVDSSGISVMRSCFGVNCAGTQACVASTGADGGATAPMCRTVPAPCQAAPSCSCLEQNDIHNLVCPMGTTCAQASSGLIVCAGL